MKGKLIPRVSSNDNISVLIIVAYGVVFALVLYVIFTHNQSCLLCHLDGLLWITRFAVQDGRIPFSQLGVDPLQGNFDAYLPAFREYFLPEALALPFNQAGPSKVLIYTTYGILMVASTYALARSVGFSRSIGLFAGMLLATIALPTSVSTFSWIYYAVYNICPHLAQITSVAVLIIACFWAIDFSHPLLTVTLVLAAVALTVLSIASWVTVTALMLPTIAIYGGASLVVSRTVAEALSRVATAVGCLVVPAALGMIGYAIAIERYTAYHFFDYEFMQTRASLDYASILYQPNLIGKFIILFGLAGALYAAFTASRRIRAFAWTHVGTTVVFQVIALLVVTFANGYHGPSPIYFEFMLWPVMLIFVAFGATAVLQHVAVVLRSAARLPALPCAVVLHHAPLLAVPLLLMGWNVFAMATGRDAHCEDVGFFPIRSNAITEHLRDKVAIAVGRPFRGLVATFDGVQGKPSIDRFQLHPTDYMLWQKLGNDMRLVGLWNENIPTLIQYSPLITPSYYLLLTEFLARPTDRQMRSILALSQPNQRMLELWGVRFLIADFDPGFGRTQITMPVHDSNDLRLIELGNANLGDYSPTEVQTVDSFRAGLDLMRGDAFDGRRMVVTERSLVGPLVPADHVRVVYEQMGFAVSALSQGRSILVLPIQYSNCWSITGKGDAMLFRADLMQLGISFAGDLDVHLVFRFGPFLAAHCRLQDYEDMERLHIREARKR
jgi:hypothetical protein